VNVLVLVTDTSGPACRWMPEPHARAIELPGVFTIPSTVPPLRVISCTAASVSKVSPDWLTATYRASGSMTGLR
jgi:hypothetical protein